MLWTNLTGAHRNERPAELQRGPDESDPLQMDLGASGNTEPSDDLLVRIALLPTSVKCTL